MCRPGMPEHPVRGGVHKRHFVPPNAALLATFEKRGVLAIFGNSLRLHFRNRSFEQIRLLSVVTDRRAQASAYAGDTLHTPVESGPGSAPRTESPAGCRQWWQSRKSTCAAV